ncbi:hypothetical protein [Marinifilum caeruleilacunae]|uniref:Peptidase M50 domain-containing protein n=1 Tax=Marinifilum caeruleilacunae TaxID=2499076 RepID=A0ABX1WZU8_9BACT|nr:hypothetical protein [Marinifilum caeruleilacunae]NOU61384.1 hypothetical protein [Marinifilum caeruleilacunae]
MADFIKTISKDLQESQINWKVAILFIPIAFASYLFHEFGHWCLGEFLGNDMVLSLNNASPKSGRFIEASHALWSAIGGPLFTILQAMIFLLICIKNKSTIAYSVVFFAVFLRFYCIVFGGLQLQDEGRIASMLGTNKYLIAAIVLMILFSILWKASRTLKLSGKAIGYYSVLSVIAILSVIGTYQLI